jgi:4-amino-4-deoxy-L-arabinose transferase-like glycosyltransferase
MSQTLNNRCGHYALLLLVLAGLCLPVLGFPSLWDIDEGKNAEAAREMLEAGNWVLPTFNYQFRFEKPALLYWLQIGAYQFFGVNEFAARLPSALAALLTVLLTYELGRRLFGPRTGLLSGLVLASAAAFGASSQFANPDALLSTFTAWTLLACWCGLERPARVWFVLAGIGAGLAVLAKGPIGIAGPGAVVILFLLWSGRLRALWTRRLGLAIGVMVATALPWYVWIGVDTKGQFLNQFLLRENLERALNPMEHHSGPPYYYLAVLLVGFAPWSAFLGLAAWYAFRDARGGAGLPTPPTRAIRFLACWIGVYLIVFSLARTKLPNYILPVYPPVALLTARFLDRWRTGDLRPPAWRATLGLGSLALVGVIVGLGLLVAGGAVDLPGMRVRTLPGLAPWAMLGFVPILGAGAAWWCLRRHWKTGMVSVLVTTAVLFLGALLACGTVAIDALKAPRNLVETAGARQTDRDVRVACYQYFQPSLVFYCRREVSCLETEKEAAEFLRSPLPVYLFVPAAVWEGLREQVQVPCQLVARHGDLYRNCDIVVVANQPAKGSSRLALAPPRADARAGSAGPGAPTPGGS